MSANNLSSYSTARTSDAPQMPVRTSNISSTTAFVSQTPASSSSSETRPVLTTHPAREQSFSEGRSNWEASRENPVSQPGVRNQPTPTRASASRSPAAQNDLFGNVLTKSLVSAFMAVLDLSENTIMGCAYSLQNKGLEVTKDALYDECMKYKEHSWPRAQTDYGSVTEFSDLNSQTSLYPKSFQSTETNQSFNTNSNFSSTSLNSPVTNLQCFQPPFVSMTSSHSRRERSNTGSKVGNRRRRRAPNVSDRNAESETEIKQGFSFPTRDSHASFMSDTGYSTMSNSSSSSGLSEAFQFSFESTRASSAQTGQRPTFLPLSSSAGFSDSGFGRDMTSGFNSTSASSLSSRSYFTMPKSTSETAQHNRYHKEPVTANSSKASCLGIAGDKRAASSLKDNSARSSSLASSNDSEFTQLNIDRNASGSNRSSKTPSASSISRSENNPDSRYGGEAVSTLESGMESLQLSRNTASNNTRRGNNELSREVATEGNRSMTNDEELLHALSVLNGDQK